MQKSKVLSLFNEFFVDIFVGIYAKHKIRWYFNSRRTCCTWFFGRRKAFYRRERVNAATKIQAHYRGMKERMGIRKLLLYG